MATLRLAVAQVAGELNSAQRILWLEKSLAIVAKKGADLLLLPELFMTGYNISGTMKNQAEVRDGVTATMISTLAQKFGVAIHYGFAERDGDAIYNSAQCFGADGVRLGGHRKLVFPLGMEREIFAAGQGCSVFIYKGVTIGTLICYDAEFAETARHVTVLGAELILVPTALDVEWGWIAHKVMPTRGYENGVFLAYANSAGVGQGMEFLGASFISAPEGKEIARAGTAPEILYADIDTQLVQKAQSRLPYLNDLKNLNLNSKLSD